MGMLSSEETDHLERSVKKIKASVEGNIGEETQPVAIRSFKDTLVSGKKTNDLVAALGNIDKVAFDVETDWSDDEVMIDEVVDNSIPTITIDKEVKKNLRSPQKSALIMKILGKTLNFTTFQTKVLKLWCLDGDADFIDIGLGYYIVKFDIMSDFVKVLTRGPWKIVDHFLSVQRWKPEFHPSKTKLGATAVWVRCPELPIEYFHEDILMDIVVTEAIDFANCSSQVSQESFGPWMLAQRKSRNGSNSKGKTISSNEEGNYGNKFSVFTVELMQKRLK
ncbi:hypothetical protein REPUB_Repub03eG0273300 [Reevesia pubescens]